MIDWMVLTVTMFAFVFTVIWLFFPGFRARVEQPKFDMLKRLKRDR